MNCLNCGRSLRDDSKFCDYCGQQVPLQINSDIKTEFDFKALFFAIILSILVTFLLFLLSRALGFPIIIGVAFLPFLWRKVFKIKEQ